MRLAALHARLVQQGWPALPAEALQRLQHVEPEPGWLQFVQLQQLQPGTG